MVKSILKWNDSKFEECLAEEGPKSFAKAVGCGAVEGLIDGLAIIGAWCMVCSVISSIKK